jgi:hypothetical protein
MNYDENYFDEKWQNVIKHLPIGGNYRFDLRQYGYDIIKDYIKPNTSVFDFACGLGIIDIQLEKEKGCGVGGCDFSEVAIKYVESQCEDGHFKQTDKIFGGKFDYVIAIYYIEHIKNPVEWLDEMFEHTDKVICAIPNNFNRTGEHIDMQWKSWDSFYELFSKFKVTRLDTGKYPDRLVGAFKHPIFLYEKKKKKKKKRRKHESINSDN